MDGESRKIEDPAAPGYEIGGNGGIYKDGLEKYLHIKTVFAGL